MIWRVFVPISGQKGLQITTTLALTTDQIRLQNDIEIIFSLASAHIMISSEANGY